MKLWALKIRIDPINELTFPIMKAVIAYAATETEARQSVTDATTQAKWLDPQATTCQEVKEYRNDTQTPAEDITRWSSTHTSG